MSLPRSPREEEVPHAVEQEPDALGAVMMRKEEEMMMPAG
jgi:hypothetical protein